LEGLVTNPVVSAPATMARRSAYACPCMKVTHAEVAEAAACPTVRTLNDLRCRTGAGDGCMACHRRLRCYLEPAAEVSA
jgi:bacterioferritin-associated ferredoxin